MIIYTVCVSNVFLADSQFLQIESFIMYSRVAKLASRKKSQIYFSCRESRDIFFGSIKKRVECISWITSYFNFRNIRICSGWSGLDFYHFQRAREALCMYVQWILILRWCIEGRGLDSVILRCAYNCRVYVKLIPNALTLMNEFLDLLHKTLATISAIQIIQTCCMLFAS